MSILCDLWLGRERMTKRLAAGAVIALLLAAACGRCAGVL